MLRKLWRRWTAIKDPWGVDIEFYGCLGILAAEWSRVEELLGVLVFVAIGIKPGVGNFLIANIGFRSRVLLLNAEIQIYKEMGGVPTEIIDEMEGAIKDLNDLYPKRNYYVHSFYWQGSGERDADTHVLRVKGKVRDLSRTVTLDEVIDTYEQIFQLRERIVKLIHRLDEAGYHHDKPLLEDVPPEMLATPVLDPTSTESPSPSEPSKG
jgi:hypothetical protein